MEPLHELRTLILERCRDGGGKAAAIADGVTVAVVDEPTPPVVAARLGPTLAIVAQGTMRTVLNGEPYEYGAGKYLVAPLDLPSTSQVVRADPDEPLVIFIMDLQPQAVASLLLETGDAVRSPAGEGVFVRDVTPKLLDPVVRLVRAARCPEDLRVLGPSYQREILWRLLTEDQGALTRHIAQADSGLPHIARAIGWIQEHYDEPLRVADLARLSGMSPSSFHRRFRAATSATPLQFQKTIRLQTARTLLWSRSESVAEIAHRVGYESTSQFNREYRKMFGTSPGRDTPRHGSSEQS